MDEAGYLDVISGHRRGVTAEALRAALAAAEPAYKLGLRFDQWRQLRRARGVNAPVVSVGNLTCGGTGKTPVVAWLAKRLAGEGWTPGLLSRGYGAPRPGLPNDEARVLEALCPQVPQARRVDRRAGALELEAAGCDVILLDDGFQHRKLKRDCDIVLLDALNPWGHDRCLPRGLLREPPEALGRADIVVINRIDAIGFDARRRLEDRVAELTDAPVATGRVRPINLVNAAGGTAPLEALSGWRLLAFCGLGNPGGFAATLSQLNAEPVELMAFPDHHRYDSADLRRVCRRVETLRADAVVTTRKDLVKLAGTTLAGRPVWAVDIAFEPLTRSDVFDHALPRRESLRVAA